MNRKRLQEIHDYHEDKAQRTNNDFEMALTSWDVVELVDAILADQPTEEQ